MKRYLQLLVIAVLLAVLCAPPPPAAVTVAKQSPPTPEPAEDMPAAVYIPPEAGLSAEETVTAYIEQLYLSYLHMTDIDLSAILDLREPDIRGSVIWMGMLNQRRRLLLEHELCYVETQAYPIDIRFLEPEELNDNRMEEWSDYTPVDEREMFVHFVVSGDKGHAYPPQLAVNAQQTIILRWHEDMWKVGFHYFPGSIRKFLRERYLTPLPDDEVLEALLVEFGEAQVEAPPLTPDGAYGYDGDAAAAYALLHTEAPNPLFYKVDDFMGNCANFTSQSIWAGFVGHYSEDDVSQFRGMTREWYAGEGGGSPAWENVEQFWSYITAGDTLGGQMLEGIAAAQSGDLLQTSSGFPTGDGGRIPYNHSLLVVDADRLLLAQNSPGCFVYYADIVNVETRLIRPMYVVS